MLWNEARQVGRDAERTPVADVILMIANPDLAADAPGMLTGEPSADAGGPDRPDAGGPPASSGSAPAGPRRRRQLARCGFNPLNLPHAEVHTVVLPHATAYNRDFAPDAMKVAADALGVSDAAQGIFDLIGTIGAPRALKDIGMPADGIERAAELATKNQYPNPRPIEIAPIRELLRNAYEGRRPSQS